MYPSSEKGLIWSGFKVEVVGGWMSVVRSSIGVLKIRETDSSMYERALCDFCSKATPAAQSDVHPTAFKSQWESLTSPRIATLAWNNRKHINSYLHCICGMLPNHLLPSQKSWFWCRVYISYSILYYYGALHASSMYIFCCTVQTCYKGLHAPVEVTACFF